MNKLLRRRLLLLASLLVSAGALAFMAVGNLGENLVYYWDPSELRRAGASAVGVGVRLGGVVKPGSVAWDEARQEVRFLISDGSAEIQVRSTGQPPEMFREGMGVLVEGSLTEEGRFEATRLLVKHSEEYRAPVEGRHPNDVYRTVEGL